MSSGSEHAPITPIPVLVGVFLALLVCTVLTVPVAKQDLGVLNTAAALGIAAVKASMVVLIFMGVRHNTPLIKVAAVSGILWLAIMFGVTMSDYLTRSWSGVPGR